MEEIWKDLRKYKGVFFNGQWPTITEMFNITLSVYPDNPCFTFYDPNRISYSYTQVGEMIRRIASKMIEDGVKKGDRVLLNGKNSISWALAYLSINYCGAVIVPIDNQMDITRVQELSAFAGCSYVLADSDVLGPWVKNLKGYLSLESLMDVQPQKIHEAEKTGDEDLAALLFTSGTTGNEKAVMLTNRNIVSDTYLVADGMGCTEKDTLYALLPLHHSYCCTTVLLETIRHGAECLFGHGIVTSRIIKDLKRGGVTIFMGIPLLYNKILAGIEKGIEKKGKRTAAVLHAMMKINGFTKENFNFTPFRSFFRKNVLSQLGLQDNNLLICGAGPLSPEVFKKYNQLGLDFVQGYGLTECSPVVTLNPKEHFKTSSIGKALKGLEVIIAEPDEHGTGEIRVKGPVVTPGYYKDKEHTAELFDENGYLKTGDLGCVDKEGYFVIRGRAKNIIVTEGGKNVYPEEIEDEFQTDEGIEQIMVRGYMAQKDVPSEMIEAVIFPSPEFYRGKNAEEIREDIELRVKNVNAKLPAYKKIGKITIVEEKMKETSSKKIKRSTVCR